MHLASTKSHIFVLRHWEVIRQTYLHICSVLQKKKKKKIKKKHYEIENIYDTN
jgi:hypothetical protein